MRHISECIREAKTKLHLPTLGKQINKYKHHLSIIFLYILERKTPYRLIDSHRYTFSIPPYHAIPLSITSHQSYSISIHFVHLLWPLLLHPEELP